MSAAIQSICQALGLATSAAQLDLLAQYVQLLTRWNATYNLTAVRNPDAVLSQHVADCLAVVPPLMRHCIAGNRLLDVGSGGGLPGVVIAIMLPAVQVTCVDAVGKKSAFLRQVAGTLPLPNLRAVHGRVETLTDAGFDVIASRAFAALPAFVIASRAALAPQGAWLAMKGNVPENEIAALPAWAALFHVEQLHVPTLAAERHLLWLKQVPAAKD